MSAELVIDKLGGEGDGVAGYEGRALFVPFTLPGEQVIADIVLHKRETDVVVKEIRNPSPARVAPPCPHFTRCGGCKMQHMELGFYTNWKLSKLAFMLERAGIKTPPIEAVLTPPHSRRRAVFTAAKHHGALTLGFNERASRHLIDIQSCTVVRPAIEKLLAPLRALLADILNDGESLHAHVTEHDGVVQIVFLGLDFSREAEQKIVGWATAHGVGSVYSRTSKQGLVTIAELNRLHMTYGDYTLYPPPGGFLQASAEIESAMQDYIAQHLKGVKDFADLFCGAGTFTLAQAAKAHVLAVDADGDAIAALREAAKIDPTIKIEKRNLFNEPLTPIELKDMDAVVIDPPRAGAEAQMAQLAKSKVKKVIAISCNPQSFLRDAQLLLDGGYQFTHVKLFDQFLWSPHIELIGVFTR